MSIDAMKQALEALWNCTAKLESQLMRNPVILPTNYKDAVAEGYTAYSKLRAAIEAAEKQEPVAWMGEYNINDIRDHYTVVMRHKTDFSSMPDRVRPLYTHPQPAIPDGWQLVPAEPFNEALDILKRVRDGDLGNCVAYRMLIAAAPKPAKEEK